MTPTTPKRFPQSPIYKKAMDIFALSQNISSYIVHDLAHLQENGNEDPNIYFSGDIVQQSISLAPEIFKAEAQTFSEEKHKYAASVNHLINTLQKNCERLEHANTNGKEFIQLLRRDLKKFRKLQRSWMLTL